MKMFFDGNEINFEKEFRCESIYNLTLNCSYDFLNNSIKNGKEIYPLTKREDLFIKLLIKKRGIVTYFEMDKFLSINYKEFTINAKRIFIKNLKKKLPENLLVNVSGIGYKLIL